MTMSRHRDNCSDSVWRTAALVQCVKSGAQAAWHHPRALPPGRVVTVKVQPLGTGTSLVLIGVDNDNDNVIVIIILRHVATS